MKFIKVVRFDGKCMLINVSKINSVEARTSSCSVIKTTGKVCIEVKESFDDIAGMLCRAGVNILKA